MAGAAAAFNQASERDIDATMERTRRRPVAAGRVTPAEARLFALALAVLGLLDLALATNVAAALVALATLVGYAAVYTPLKRRTPWATIVGAVPGALPPVIGWTAARGAATVEAWVLFGIVFLWQMPHFHALSWLYREGLPARRPAAAGGSGCDRPASLQAGAAVRRGAAAGESRAGAGRAGRAAVRGGRGAARAGLHRCRRAVCAAALGRAGAYLFRASLVYLPLLWTLLVVERYL